LFDRLTPFFFPFISPTHGPYSILIGELDEEIDKSVDLSTVRVDPIPPIRY